MNDGAGNGRHQAGMPGVGEAQAKTPDAECQRLKDQGPPRARQQAQPRLQHAPEEELFDEAILGVTCEKVKYPTLRPSGCLANDRFQDGPGATC